MEKIIPVKIIQVMKTQYVITCPKCGKELVASTEKRAKYNLMYLHNPRLHPTEDLKNEK